MSRKIAFLGLGTMGGPMAMNLHKAGFGVTGWNRSAARATAIEAREAGVPLAATVGEAVDGADVIGLCVGDVEDVHEVLFGEAGVAAAARPGALVLDFSTIGPVAAREICRHLRDRKLRFLDAPVTGGDVGARAGTLTIMVGGERDDFEAARPVFAPISRLAKYCGGSGDGQAVKLCNQVLAALHMVALTESLALARRQKIDPNLVVEVCSTGAAGSWALANLGPRVVARDFQPGFMVKHLVKDLRLVLESPPDETLDELRGTILAKSLFERVCELGGSELGTQSLIQAYERR